MPQSESDEYTVTEVGSEEDEYDLEGALKMNLVWDASSKQLSVKLKQFVQTKYNTEVKYKGQLNTVTGAHHMRGQLVKTFTTNVLSLQKVYAASKLQTMRQRIVAEGSSSRNKEALQQISSQLRDMKIDPDAFLPGGFRPLLLTDWVICPGLTFDSGRGSSLGLRPALILKKAPQVLIHSPRTDLMLTAKAITDFEPGSNKVSVGAGLRLKLYKFNVTSKQDLKVSVGLDLNASPLDASAPSPGKSWRQTPYLKISENNTSVKLQAGRWLFQYRL